MEAPQHDEIDDAVDAALAKSEFDPKAAALAEERVNAQRIAAANKVAEETKPAVEDLTELPMVSILARGRDALEEAMRQHQQKKHDEPPYVPPPMSAAQAARLNEEIEAGRRTQQKHQAQVEEQRKLRAAQSREPWEGSNTPVHRPGIQVPNPTGGHGTFSPTA